MLDEQPPSKWRLSRRWLAVVALLVAIVSAVVVARWNSALSPFERRLAGSWTTPYAPGQIRVITLTADRRVSEELVAERTGETVGEAVGPGEATWSVEDQQLIIERRRAGVSLFDALFGKPLYSRDLIPLVSVSDDQFVVEFGTGNTAHRLTFKRATTSLWHR